MTHEVKYFQPKVVLIGTFKSCNRMHLLHLRKLFDELVNARAI